MAGSAKVPGNPAWGHGYASLPSCETIRLCGSKRQSASALWFSPSYWQAAAGVPLGRSGQLQALHYSPT